MENNPVIPFLKIPVAVTIWSYSKLVNLLHNPLGILSDLTKKYGGIIQLKIFHKKFIVVEDPEYFKFILQEQNKTFQKYDLSGLFLKFLGNGLITSNGQTWLSQRRAVQPAFHKQQLKHMIDTIHDELDHLISRLKNQGSSGSLDASSLFMELNFGIITNVLFGGTANNEVKLISCLMKDLAIESEAQATQIVKLPLGIPSVSNLRFKKVRTKFDFIIYGIIRKRRKLIAEKTLVPPDILQMLLISGSGETEAGMCDKQIRDELTTLFIAGYETTSQTLAWLFYRVGRQPEIASLIRAEVNSVQPEQKLGMEDLSSLKYTTSVIKETMRFYPAVWLIVRQNISNAVLGHFHLPKRSVLLLNVYGMHHNKLYWEEPDEFRAGRFNEHNMTAHHSFSYLPFGAGPRLCIGQPFAMMIMQLVVGRLLTSFDCKLTGTANVKLEPHVTLRPSPGVYIELTSITT